RRRWWRPSRNRPSRPVARCSRHRRPGRRSGRPWPGGHGISGHRSASYGLSRFAFLVVAQRVAWRRLLRERREDLPMRQLFSVAAIFALLGLVASPAAAQAPFFQGRQLKVLVGFPPGGGTDLYGRVIA